MAITTQNYQFEVYTDNWSNWQNQFPLIPTGVNGDVGFAVPNPDGTLNTQDFPITPGQGSPAQPGCTGLAVGGWTASQSGGGLYAILTQNLTAGGLTQAQQTLIQSIVTAASQNGYTRIIMDYENYESPAPNPAIYTTFLQELGQTLHGFGMTLEIAMSPSSQNQQYYDIAALVSSGAVDLFQLMCYDYARGQGTPVHVQANASIALTRTYVQSMLQQIPASKLAIGVELYGVGYQIQAGMSPSEVEQLLQNGTLTGSYTDSVTISDDQLLALIGSWEAPNAPWQIVNDGAAPPNYFYYNQTTGTIYDAFPPQSMDNFANMIHTEFPAIRGVFSWDADNDRSGQMMQCLVSNVVGQSLPSTLVCINELYAWLNNLKAVRPDWITSFRNALTNNPPQTTEELVNRLNQIFTVSGPLDLYLSSGLLLSSPTGNVQNQLQALFGTYTNLLPLLPQLTIPTPTFADVAFAQAGAWKPNSWGGIYLRAVLRLEIISTGSALTKAEIDSWAYNLNPANYADLSASDSAQFTNITGAWL